MMMRRLANRLARIELARGEAGRTWPSILRLIQDGDSIRHEHGHEIDAALRCRIETDALREDEHSVIRVIVSPPLQEA